MILGIRILSLSTSNSLLGELMSGIGQGSVLLLGWETILESHVVQRHEDLEMRQANYQIIILPEST